MSNKKISVRENYAKHFENNDFNEIFAPSFWASEFCVFAALAFNLAWGVLGEKATIEHCLDALTLQDEFINEGLDVRLVLGSFIKYHFAQQITASEFGGYSHTLGHYEEWVNLKTKEAEEGK